MAYKKENFRLKQTVGDFFSEFVYVTEEDNLAAVKASNYFDQAIKDYGLRDGDVICIFATDKAAFAKATVALDTATITLFVATAEA